MTKKYVLLALLMVVTLATKAQITFQFCDGIDEGDLKTKAEKNISLILTGINQAALTSSTLDLDGVTMTPEARSGLQSLWGNIHFRCLVVKRMIQSCIQDATGYEVRQIPIEVIPLDSTYRGEMTRELTMSFDRKGTITGVRMALDDNSYLKIMEDGNSVSDIRQRREISKFVEDFRSYYIEKNAAALEQIFSDDALIITGRVIKTTERSRMDANSQKVKEKIIYSKQTKQQYIDNLRLLFKNNAHLDVKFDDVEVLRHSSKEGYFGVRLRQTWRSQNKQGKVYADEGYVFLLWDFTDEANPKIHVRQWAPNSANVTQDDLLSADDFFIP